MSSLKDRLSNIESAFLSAVVEGGDALSAFDKDWDRLLNELDDAFESGALDEETSALAHTTASRVATLADISAEVVDSYNALSTQLMGQLESMMSELRVTDCVVSDLSPHSSSAHPESIFSAPRNAQPSHVREASLSRKRRRASESSSEGSSADSIKRPRTGLAVVPSTPFPFISTTTTESHLASQVALQPSHASSEVRPHSLKRKRRLSDAAITLSSSKGSKRLYAGPRTHAVSDTFLLACTPRDTALCSSRSFARSSIEDSSPVVPLPPLSLDIQPLIPDVHAEVTDFPLSPPQDYSAELSDFGVLASSIPPQSEYKELDEFLQSLLAHSVPQNSLALPLSLSNSPVNASQAAALSAKSPSSILSSSSSASSHSTPSSTPSPLFPLTPTMGSNLDLGPSEILFNNPVSHSATDEGGFILGPLLPNPVPSLQPIFDPPMINDCGIDFLSPLLAGPVCSSSDPILSVFDSIFTFPMSPCIVDSMA